jgi:hypothetical protein
MAHQDDTAVAAESPNRTRSAAAERMRAHRDRRRAGLRCVGVQLRETEIDVLIRKGLLKADARNDLYAVRDALHEHFDYTLGTQRDA